MRVFPILLFLLISPALAQTPGTCEHGTAHADLDVSDVRATVLNNGNLFYGPLGGDEYINNAYRVPKSGSATPLYAANVWVGGMVDSEVRVASASFLDFEFWPGPLEEGATLPDPDDCSAYDRIWVVSTEDVAVYEEAGEATPDLAEWPVELGAEVVDGDGIEGNYDLASGDRPRVYGSQTAFWVMNDVGGEHVRTGSQPIGLEVQVTAFAIVSEVAALNQATFYRYRLVNRNTASLEDAYFTFWVDSDLGAAGDEWPGVDTTRALGFVYNANDEDAAYGIPPAFGIDLLGGAGSFRYALNGAAYPVHDPISRWDVYNTQRGLWSDGTPMTEGGDGYLTDGPQTIWAFPGDPVTQQCWSAINDCTGHSLLGMNHRLILSSPAFSLAPGEARTFDVALVFAQGTDRLDSVTELRAASDLVQAAYDDGSLFDARFPVGSAGETTAPAATHLDAVHPNPVGDAATVTYRVREPGAVRLVVYDVLGRPVKVLTDGPVAAGEHRARLEADGLASGVYLVVLEAGGERRTRKILVVH